MSCGIIFKGQLQDCAVPPVEGVKQKLWIIPFADFQASTIVFNTQTKFEGFGDIIESITLPLGGSFVFEGYKASQQLSTITKEREFSSPVFTHQWAGVIIPRSIEDKANLEQLIKSRFVVIVENNDKGEDGQLAFELYGREVGLAHMESTQVKNENGGGWSVTFATPETESEPKPPISIFDTDYATTKEMIVGLETPTPL